MSVEEDTRAFIEEGFRRLENTVRDRPVPQAIPSPARTVVVSVIGVVLAGAITYGASSLIGQGERLVKVEVGQEEIKKDVAEVKTEVEEFGDKLDALLMRTR